MAFRIEHRKYDHQLRDPAKYPNTAPYWVWSGDQHVGVIRGVQPQIADLPEEHGFDLRLDCETASPAMRAEVDAYFAPRKVVYLQHPGWKWNHRGESTPG